MDIVLGVSTAPTTVRMVLVEGENADGVTVDEDHFEVTVDGESASAAVADQVIAAILGTREAALEAGYRLTSTGVTWTDAEDAPVLRDALDSRQIDGVMLVGPLLAAAALAQTVGTALGYQHIALLFAEPRSATLAVVNCTDGSIVDLHRRLVNTVWGEGDTAELAADAAGLTSMVSGLESLGPRPEGVFIVGCGVDVVPIKPRLEEVTTLPVSAPEEPDTALARGAALASANAPLFASSTAALAYAQDPGTGEVDQYAVAPTYLDVSGQAGPASGALAYSALPEDTDEQTPRRHRPILLVGSAAAAAFLIGVVALVVSLVVDVRPTVSQRPQPGGGVVIPTEQAPAPPTAQPPAPAASAPPAAPPPVASPAPPAAPAPPTAAPSPPPETIPEPAPVVAPHPAPVHRTPAPQAPAYVAPAAPAPQPAPEAPPAPPAAPPAAPPPPPPAAPPPPAPAMPPMTMYLRLPFVTVPIPINPPPPAPPPGP